jgi:hypothetical protein
VRPDELSGLRLYVPETAQGETVLEIALIASDGETLAEAQTALKVTAPVHVNTAAPAPAPVPGFDPYAGPSIGEVAALQVPVPEAVEASEGLAPEPQASEPQAAEASEPQASEPAEAETAATEDDPDAGAAEAAADEAASSEAANGEAASGEAASEPTSGPVTGEPVAGEPVSEPTSPESGPFADSGAKPEPSLALSDFVNLRARPTSSARVIAVIAKGTKVTPKAKRRGWLKVTDAESGKTGWIYGRYAGGTAQASNTSPSRLSAGATADEESVLTKFGRWLVY